MKPFKPVKVSKRHQVIIPRAARKKLKFEPGDRLLMDLQDGMILLTPEPESYMECLAGLD